MVGAIEEMKLYRIWYKSKGTNPLMPCAVCATTKEEKQQLMQRILSDGRFEICAVTESEIAVQSEKGDAEWQEKKQ